MPRGTPDGGYSPYSLANNQADIGTIADRLLMGGGSTSKSGRIIWATGFEGSSVLIDMVPGGTGGGSGPTGPFICTQGVADLNATGAAWQGNNYAVLQTDAIIGSQSTIFKYFPSTLLPGKWGIEAMLDFGDTYNSHINILMKRVGTNGKTTLTGSIQITIGASSGGFSSGNIRLQYKNNAGVYTDFDTVSWDNVLALEHSVWYNAKLVVNFDSGLYGYFRLNGTVYDLSTIPLFPEAAGTNEKSPINFFLTADAAARNALGIDNVILTADEP